MKKNIKITIAALSVLLVMAIATTVASFSRAGEADNPTPLAITDDDITEYDRNTNIDYIIICILCQYVFFLLYFLYF